MSFKEYLSEQSKEQSDEYIMQTLADNDINASIKDGVVYVEDSVEVKSAQKILTKMKIKMKVKEQK
jgi:hypothetical protein